MLLAGARALLISMSPTNDQIQELRQKLLDFNTSRVGPENYTPLLLRMNHASGEIAAGLMGKIYYQWLFIELLWVAEQLRGQGHGSLLLNTAEEHARACGCRESWLDTFSFQAPGFYEKNGYVVFGELPEYPPGHRRYFLRKRLRTGGGC
jgi:ribosomal protein S18 acetylase RimI-like enzyme